MVLVELALISGMMVGIEFFNVSDVGRGFILDLAILRIRIMFGEKD